MIALPLTVEWDGEVLRPANRERAAKRFEPGKRYQIEIIEGRSEESHRHFFACVREAWDNLSPAQTERWPSPEHLRAHALIKAGYYTERAFVCESKVAALRLASFVRPLDEFALVVTRGNIVAVFRPKSQSLKAMGTKEEFEKSKAAVIAICAELIGVTVEELTANAGSSA